MEHERFFGDGILANGTVAPRWFAAPIANFASLENLVVQIPDALLMLDVLSERATETLLHLLVLNGVSEYFGGDQTTSSAFRFLGTAWLARVSKRLVLLPAWGLIIPSRLHPSLLWKPCGTPH